TDGTNRTSCARYVVSHRAADPTRAQRRPANSDVLLDEKYARAREERTLLLQRLPLVVPYCDPIGSSHVHDCLGFGNDGIRDAYGARGSGVDERSILYERRSEVGNADAHVVRRLEARSRRSARGRHLYGERLPSGGHDVLLVG